MPQELPTWAAGRASAVGAAVALETVLVAGVVMALAISSRIVLPLGFTPVPVTAQTFVVLLVGVVAGARRAGLGAMIFLTFGVLGVPWFATGGATLGYIGGFALAAWFVGRSAEAGRLASRRSALIVMAAAHVFVYVVGASWLAMFLDVGPVTAFSLGVAPFLLGDAVKVLVAAEVGYRLVRGATRG